MIPMPIASLEAALRPSADGPDLTRYLLVCGGLLALVAGLAWAVRRLLAGQMRARAARRSLQVLDLLPLGGKQRLAVVRCYDRTFLLGLGEKEVSLVSELDPVLTPAGSGGATSVEARSFADLLSRAAVRSPREPAQRALDPRGVLG
jgi:flagellar biosynthetic protein FliO